MTSARSEARVEADRLRGDLARAARDSRVAAYHRAMKSKRQLTAIIEREDDVSVALCPELDKERGRVLLR